MALREQLQYPGRFCSSVGEDAEGQSSCGLKPLGFVVLLFTPPLPPPHDEALDSKAFFCLWAISPQLKRVLARIDVENTCAFDPSSCRSVYTAAGSGLRLLRDEHLVLTVGV